MEQITAYKAIDGTLHETPEAAESVDARIEFENWFEDHNIYGRYEGCKIDFNSFIEWFKENEFDVRRFIKKI